MSRTTQPCPRCGEPTPTPADERGRCRACFLEAVDLVAVPEAVAVERCVHCGSVGIDGDWRDDDAAADLAVEAVTDAVRVHRSVDDLSWSVSTTAVDDWELHVHARFDLDVAGGTARRAVETVATVEATTCPRCDRIAGDDFGAIVQLRATERLPTDAEVRRAREVVAAVLDDRVDRGDRDAYLTDVIERDGGLDLRLSTPRLGDQVATAIRADLGGRIETSRTLVTADADGQEVYRVTFAIRLPRFRSGDVVALDDGAALVESAGDAVAVRDLATGERRRVDPAGLDGPVATAAAADEAVVVAPIDDRSAQVIHPETNEAVTVARYPAVDLDRDTVPAITVGGRLYLLPTDGA
ncbi:MAG: 60S ribosomal export protein NMD3 [Halobacteriales archaeon]